MSKLISDANQERKIKYRTTRNTYEMFPVGTRVQVVCVHQDFRMFTGEETGVVERNDGKYLGIIVKFDKPYDKYSDTFNFNPKDLRVIGKTKCPHCGGAL